MSAAKFWNGSAWQTITTVQGPPGPQGPSGLPGSPTAPAVGNQRIIGAEALASGNITGSDMTGAFWQSRGGVVIDGKDDGSQPLALAAITPSYNCWWPLSAVVLVRVLDASWYGLNATVVLADANNMLKPDADGRNYHLVRVVHNAAASDWVSVPITCQYKLLANETYRAQLALNGTTGGTWNYYRGGGMHSWIASPGVVAR